MTGKLVIFSALLICSNGLSIGTVSEQNVNKSGTSIGDLFPDWVPFKNKHGDELGEFVPVVTKTKVKKRLASPMNFILKAVAEAEGDDYYNKGQGGSDNEDNYESKDWSDLNRPVATSDKQLNHSDLSEIDGVLGILTRQPENSITDAINNARKINTKLVADEPDEQNDRTEMATKVSATESSQLKFKDMKTEESVDYDEGSSEKQKTNVISNTKESKAKVNDSKETEDENDYDDGSSEKKINPAEDISESEARKAKILDAVDELKERHAQESRAISDKVTEEEMFKEEFDRNRLHSVEVRDKYGSRNKYKKITPEYDEYDYQNDSEEDKYKVHPIAKYSSEPKRTTPIVKKSTHIEPGKLSVFKSPQLYMIYDGSEETTVTPKQRIQKFSARFTSTPSTDNDEERISLVPEVAKRSEPTLFFAKKRKSRYRKNKTTKSATESSVADTVTENVRLTPPKDTTAADSRTDTTIQTAPSSTGSDQLTTSPDVSATGSDVSASESDITATGSDVTGPSADDTTSGTITPTNTPRLTDAIPASSEHKKEKSGDYHSEKGGGREHDSEHNEEHEEHGKKAYEGHHEDTKAAKGKHDKENHLGKYDDHGGVDKHHSEESGHYGDHHHEEHGKKHAQYEESGKHSKGHNTKGSHDVHKKEEYEKKVEFFEEEGDSAEEEKHGGFNQEREHSEGGNFKKGNLKAGHEHHNKGDTGHYGKGGHSHSHMGHKQSGGHDSHGKHGQHHFHKNGRDSGKKWVYHHGFPARTANLVVIDRRGDQLFHGPHYYG